MAESVNETACMSDKMRVTTPTLVAVRIPYIEEEDDATGRMVRAKILAV